MFLVEAAVGTNGHPADAERLFAALVASFAGQAGVTSPREPGARGFGSAALEVDGSIFSMLTAGHLVVKLPHDRVAALIAQGN